MVPERQDNQLGELMRRAWEAYKKTGDYAYTRMWAKQDEDGSLWEAFSIGFYDGFQAGRADRRRGTRLPSDWTLPKEWRDWAVTEGFAARLDIENEAAKFRDYWTAKTKDATKLDWFATWRNWMRGAKSNGRGSRKDPYAGNEGFIGAASRSIGRKAAGGHDP